MQGYLVISAEERLTNTAQDVESSKFEPLIKKLLFI